MRLLLCLFVLTLALPTNAQEKMESTLPYRQIPEYPEDYTAGNVIARMIDGLGYRYYWATEGLTEKDLAYAPSEDSRDAGNTLQHLYGLSETIVNAAAGKPNIRPADWSGMEFADFRRETLLNLEKASNLMRGKTAEEVAQLQVVFQRGDNKAEFPYWNMLNGPLADALYHTGQIVAYRRAAGNPLHPKVNVFRGKTGE